MTRGSRMSSRGPAVTTLLIAMVGPILFITLGACGDASSSDAAGSDSDAILAAAFKDRFHDLQVQGHGVVMRLLSDDADGDRHQRFIVSLASGQTLLVAHNIDVAPRVEGLAVGDEIAFSGVYEWNAEGGTIHWTHADPDGSHAPGSLRNGGRMYQ